MRFCGRNAVAQCKTKLAGQSDFDTDIYNNAIKLLIAIKEHSLNFQYSRYKMAIIADANIVFMNTRQKDNKSL